LFCCDVTPLTYHYTALITISTRVSLKKYHTYSLSLGLGPDGADWDFERIGTEKEKMNVERELKELQEKLSRVEGWRVRREEIETELKRVWVDGGEVLEPPATK
jgi:ATP-binding cassette, subfamily D (ALD), peroxisomal long-chain fatty acid import protein